MRPATVPRRGVYVLLVRVERSEQIDIGRLGKLFFDEGLYAYVGSGQSSLQKRIERHHKRKKRFHWHVDYLLGAPHARIEDTYVLEGGRDLECETARRIAALPSSRPVKGFGSSDCKCESHLYSVSRAEVARLLETLGFRRL